MSAASEVGQAKRLLSSFVSSFRPECWSGTDARRLVGDLTEVSRLVDAATTLAAGRVASTEGWKAEGHANAEEWLASTEGTTIGAAGERIRTARQLEDLPQVEEAVRQGRLSGPQTALVAAGASADPDAAARLVNDAQVDPLHLLRKKVRDVRVAARHGRVDTGAIHATRSFRSWTSDDGALEGRFRLTPDRGAQFLAALEPFRKNVFAAARSSGLREAPECYGADGLVDMALSARIDGETTVGTQVAVRVDRGALFRGWTEPGEVCEIDGIGPVPVTVARRLAGDAVLWAVLRDGDRLADVRHAGRSLPARLRVGLIERDRCCVVPGCGRTFRLEIHHLHPFALGGVGSMDNLARVCPSHHDLLTHRGARLSGPWPNWIWTPPPIGPDGEEGGPGPFDDPPPTPGDGSPPSSTAGDRPGLFDQPVPSPPDGQVTGTAVACGGPGP